MNDDTNPAPERSASAFKRGAQRFAALLRSFGLLDPGTHVSRRDHMLPADFLAAKQKLGRAYFTRRLSPRTRRARVALLLPHELAAARQRGWI